MAPRASSRTRPRRRSPEIFSGCLLLCCLILAFLVILFAFNIARILMLPEFTVRTPEREVVIKPPTYYDILGVTPLVDDEDLAKLRKKHKLEAHPDKHGNTPESVENFITKSDIFDVLQNGRLRCEYDKEHRIKGKWPVQTCRDAFREEYRQMMRDEWKKYQRREEQKQARGRQGGPKPRNPDGGEPGPSKKIKVEVKVEPLMPETDKPSSGKRDTWRGPKDEDSSPPGAKPGARRAVPRVTVEIEPEPEDTSFGIVTGTATRVRDGIVYWLFIAKDAFVECSESVSSFLGSFSSIFGANRV